MTTRSGFGIYSAGKELASLAGHSRPVTGVAFVPSGKGKEKQAVSASLDGTIRLWNLKTKEEVRKFEGHVGEVYCIAVSADGTRILSGGNDRTVRLWDAQNGKEIHCFKGHANAVIRVAFAPNQRTILSGSSQYRQPDKVIRVWNIEDGKELRALADADVSIATMTFAPDGASALSGGSDPALRLWQWSK